MKFSVLMTTYMGERPEFLEKSLLSITKEQTRKPDQVVLVIDGPVSTSLDAVIGRFEKEGLIEIVRLEKNVGQSAASKVGLEYCKYELVARMDSDDISVPERFEEQLKTFNENPELDVVGGWIGEFSESETEIKQYRKVPEKDQDIKKFFRTRNGINNVSVMMKKETLIHSGGYDGKSVNEDYSIYVQMIINDATFYNLQKMLVRVRVGNGMTKRRRNMQIFYDWKKDQKKLLKAKKTTKRCYLFSCFSCFLFVLTPSCLKKLLYKIFLRKKG